MKHLVFTPDRNTDDNDYKGAFKPESDRYRAFWTQRGDLVDVRRIDVSESLSHCRVAMETALRAFGPVDRLALLCHGWRSGVQLGLSIADTVERENLNQFARVLAETSTPELGVALYCCSTGSSEDDPQGDGGFADALRDALCAAGRPNVTVFAHTTAGHTTRNARIRYFNGNGTPNGGQGGDDPVTAPVLRRVLYARLHDKADALRWRIPYLKAAELLVELAGGGPR